MYQMVKRKKMIIHLKLKGTQRAYFQQKLCNLKLAILLLEKCFNLLQALDQNAHVDNHEKINTFFLNWLQYAKVISEKGKNKHHAMFTKPLKG